MLSAKRGAKQMQIWIYKKYVEKCVTISMPCTVRHYFVGLYPTDHIKALRINSQTLPA